MNFLLLAFSLLLSLNAVSAAHIARPHQHRALSARRAAADPLQLHQLSRRCKPRPGNATHYTHTPSTSPASEKPASPPPSSPPPPPPPPSYSSSSSSSSSPPPATSTPKKDPSPSPQNNAVNTDTTPSPTPSSTPQPSPTPASSGGSNQPSYLSGTQTGQATFYSTGLGSCGWTSDDSQYICAVSRYLYDSYPGNDGNPNHNPVCGKKIEITYLDKKVTVTVVDRCDGCPMENVDLSPSAFDGLADPGLGRIPVTWEWVS